MEINDEEQRRRLTEIERNLAAVDPALARRFDRLGRSATTWRGMAASLLLLLVNSEIFLFALGSHKWWLLVVSTGLFTVVMYPTTRSMARKGRT